VNEHDYIDSLALEAHRAEVMERGFERDPLVGENADRPYAGLNLAVAWPLPRAIEPAYLDFERRTRAIDEGIYVYPFATTHVTVLTAVNFKLYPDPTPDFLQPLEAAAAALGDFVREATTDMAPFALDIGSPVLARVAAFLPIRNPTGEIDRLRERALAFCREAGGILADASAPTTIHSTILRFRDLPRDPAAFARAFTEVANTFHPCRVLVDRVLVTFEMKPYMRAGSVASSIALPNADNHAPVAPRWK
jgi:hypothetical protein